MISNRLQCRAKTLRKKIHIYIYIFIDIGARVDAAPFLYCFSLSARDFENLPTLCVYNCAYVAVGDIETFSKYICS